MQTKQRGSGWSIKLVYRLYKLFGYNFIYFFLYFVVFYYFLFAKNIKEALKIFYKNIDREFNNRVYFEHLRYFALCMTDRFLSKENSISYKFIIKNPQKLKDDLSRGAVLILSHFGGWATLSSALRDSNLTVNMVMQEALLDEIKDIEESIKSQTNINIIDISKGFLSVAIEVANALSNREIVGMMGDRAVNQNSKNRINFFEKEATFNKNPFEIAYNSKTNLIIIFNILKAKREYEIFSLNIEFDKNLSKKEAINKAMREYVLFLEKITKEYPMQWFNFYDFWKE